MFNQLNISYVIFSNYKSIFVFYAQILSFENFLSILNGLFICHTIFFSEPVNNYRNKNNDYHT